MHWHLSFTSYRWLANLQLAIKFKVGSWEAFFIFETYRLDCSEPWIHSHILNPHIYAYWWTELILLPGLLSETFPEFHATSQWNAGFFSRSSDGIFGENSWTSKIAEVWNHSEVSFFRRWQDGFHPWGFSASELRRQAASWVVQGPKAMTVWSRDMLIASSRCREKKLLVKKNAVTHYGDGWMGGSAWRWSKAQTHTN